jgi:hypothetical protein
LQIDADAERAHFPDRFEDDAGHADLVEREAQRESPDAAARDQHRIIRHVYRPIRNGMSSLSSDAAWRKGDIPRNMATKDASRPVTKVVFYSPSFPLDSLNAS